MATSSTILFLTQRSSILREFLLLNIMWLQFITLPLRHNVLKSILFVLQKKSECMVNMLSNGW